MMQKNTELCISENTSVYLGDRKRDKLQKSRAAF